VCVCVCVCVCAKEKPVSCVSQHVSSDACGPPMGRSSNGAISKSFSW
jgi:hypothetical protein